MLSSCKTCWISLYKRAELFLHVNPCKRRKHLRLSAGFDLIPSSFGVMELSGQFRQVFKVIDANGDGKISSLELSEVLLCLGHEKSTASKAAEGMIREMDFNGDGFIDLDEFMHAVNMDGAICSHGEEDYFMDASLIFDTDKNGLISANELRKVQISLGFSKCSLPECKRMIKGGLVFPFFLCHSTSTSTPMLLT